MRSPNYPQLSLPDAIERVRTVYKTLHTAKADQNKVVQILGYGSLNGRSMGVLSALRKYGLLQGTGDALNVSHDAVVILERQPGHPERVEALRKASLAAPLFAEIHSKFEGQIPADEDLRIMLAAKGFSRTATNDIANIYRDTMGLVSGEAGEYTERVASEPTSRQELLPMPIGTDRPTSEPSQRANAHPFRVERLHSAPLVVEPEADQELKFKISADSEARITFRGEVTLEAIDKLIKLLELSKDTFPSRATLESNIRISETAIRKAAQGAIARLGMDVQVLDVTPVPDKTSEWWIDFSNMGRVLVQRNPGESLKDVEENILENIVTRNFVRQDGD